MQSSAEIQALSQGTMRKLSWNLRMSFPRDFNDLYTFFTIGSSLIAGGDFIPGPESVVQDWDKYSYADYSNRVISVEWTREVDFPSSVTLAMCDLVLDNHDDYFTPERSPISQYILPYRPIRLQAGFSDVLLPAFIGVTQGMPVIDEKNKTATFHCIDFLYAILNRSLDQMVMLEDNRTDEILTEIFIEAGLLSSQLDLDFGVSTIPFYYAEKGAKVLDEVKKLMEAEQGRLYMTEAGVITFRNRQTYDSAYSYLFNIHNIVDFQTKGEDKVINVVEIDGHIRTVQPKQSYWTLPSAVKIPANGNEDIEADFNDPVTTVDTPLYTTSAVTSSYTVNTLEDGSGSASSSLTLGVTQFGTAFKMTFTNPTASDLWVTAIELFATPATVTENFHVREENTASSDQYDERVLSIQNDLFQSQSDGQSKALVILDDYAEFGGVQQVTVKGSPAIQLDDVVRVEIYGDNRNYKVQKISNKLMQPAKYTQILELKHFEPKNYFTIGTSLIQGSDQLHP